MQLSRALRLLVVGLSAASVAEATFVNLRAAGVGNGIQRRQEDEEDDAPAATTTTLPPPPETTTTTRPADPQTTTTSDDAPSTTTSTPPRTSSSSSTKETSTPSPSKSTPSSTSNKPDPTPPPEDNSSSDEETPEPSTHIITQIITSTLADGSVSTMTSEILTTAPPGLANGGGSGQSSGMSPQTRNTVIGVVVGVGGAIILGGLALVAWRIWGRKKHQEENDGLMDYGSAIDSNKPETIGGSMTGRTPFQSTLESYHAPTHVNTAANF